MIRFGKSLNRQQMEAYHLQLADKLEREVVRTPESIAELARQIQEMEYKLGGVEFCLAFEYAIR